MALQLRRGTNAERLSMTPLIGELIYVTDYELVTLDVTAIDAGTNTLTAVSHGLIVDQQIKFIGTNLNGLTEGQVYFIKAVPTSDTFTLSLTLGGSVVDITGTFTVDLVFATTPTDAAGAPLGTNSTPLWVGDGETVGGIVAASLNLDDLLDVEITAVAEGNTFYYDATTGFWRNTNIINVNDVTNNVTLTGDLAVNGGDITTTQTTASVFDSTATTVNAFGSATAVNIGASTGTLSIDNPTITGTFATTFNMNGTNPSIVSSNAGTASVFNTNITTVNAFGAATNITLGVDGAGAGAGTTTIRSATTVVKGDLQVNGDNTGVSADITTTKTTASVFDSNATTVNAFGAATALDIGAATGTTTINNNAKIDGTGYVESDLTVNNGTVKTNSGNVLLFDTIATTVDAFGAATAVNIGAATGTTTIEHDLTVNGGNINLNGSAVTAQKPFITFETQADGVNSLYGIRGKSSLNDPWFVGSGSTGVDQGFLEIATGDNAGGSNSGGQIYVRQYNTGATAPLGVPWEGGTGTVVNEFVLLDNVGDTSIPNDLTVGGTITTEGVLIDLTTPVHQGQLLYVSDESPATITNSSTINFADVDYRPNFQQKNNIYGRTASGLQVSNHTGAVNYTTGDGGSLLIGVDSDSQATSLIGSLSTSYNTTGDHDIRLSTSTANFSQDQATSIITSNTLVFASAHGFAIGDKLIYPGPTQNGLTYDTTYYVIATGFTTTQCQVSLTLGGSAVALTNGTGLSLWFNNNTSRLISANNVSLDLLAPNITLNATNTGIAGVDAGLTIERGTSGGDATFKWIESNLRFQANASIYSLGNLVADGPNIQVNADSTAADSFLYMKGTTEYLKWDNSASQFELSDDLLVSGAVAADSFIVDAQAAMDSSTLTTTSTATVALNVTARNAMTGLINIIQGANVHCLNYTALRTGASTAMLTTYGEMYSGSALATFTADVSAGDLRLLVTPTSATSTVFSVVRTSLT